jgi:hypothetical protein
VVIESKRSKPEAISRGLLPSGTAMLVYKAKEWRQKWAKEHHKIISNSNVDFLDIGSGDGSILLTVSILTTDDDGAWRVAGIENTVGVHASIMQWPMDIGRACPMMGAAIVDIQRNIFCKDASDPTDRHVARCLCESDVIFINNLCFDATIQTGGRTLNMKERG